MNRQLGVLTISTLGWAFAMTAASDVIYDNGYSNDGATASDFEFAQIADDFELQAGNVTITDIHWWGIYDVSPTAADNFTIRIFADTGDGPAVNPIHQISGVSSNRVLTGGLVQDTYPEYSYSVDIVPIVLTANTTYWLSIVNDTDQQEAEWFWSHDSGGNGYIRSADGIAFHAYSYDYAFYLTDTVAIVVPEPASMTLLGLGLAGLVLRKCRKA